MPSSGYYSDTYQDLYGTTVEGPTEQSGAWVTHGSLEAEQANQLWRHYGTRTVGINVYILNDGTATTDDPDGTTIMWSDVRTVIWGGHLPTLISDEDRTALVDGGYTVIDG